MNKDFSCNAEKRDRDGEREDGRERVGGYVNKTTKQFLKNNLIFFIMNLFDFFHDLLEKTRLDN